jgi:hypothetical protein
MVLARMEHMAEQTTPIQATESLPVEDDRFLQPGHFWPGCLFSKPDKMLWLAAFHSPAEALHSIGRRESRSELIRSPALLIQTSVADLLSGR